MKLISKLPNVATTIFSVMTQLANDYQAINLAQGFPDFDAHPELVGLVEKYMRSGNNQYAPMQGVAALTEAISDKIAAIYDARISPQEEITITAGATEAIFAAITAVVHPGDEVILFEPAYDAYRPIVELNQGVPVYLKLKFPDYRIDWNRVADTVTPRTRLVVLNSPHNPTGMVLSAEDIQALAQIVQKHHLFLVSDEVYEHIVFDGCKHLSLLRYPELRDRSFVISSFGKTYHTTGWKVGYCVAPTPLTQEFRKIHQFLTFAVNTPVQHAYAEILLKSNLYLQLSGFYQAKRDLFLQFLKPSRFRALACHGTYFAVLDYSGISAEPDLVFARRLIEQHRVAAIPPSAFYHQQDDNKVLRFCFAKTDQTLEEAAGRLCEI